jgi:hypothetical protein
MSKAFLREPDMDTQAFCPRCGALGTAVGEVTLRAHAKVEALGRLAPTGWFCGHPPCEVAYFDACGAWIGVVDLTEPATPKDPDAPLCACFGVGVADVAADVAEGTPTRIRALMARAQSPDARCAECAANGQCCLPEVRKLYMRLRGGA